MTGARFFILIAFCVVVCHSLSSSDLILNSTALSQSYQNSNATLNLNVDEVCKSKGGQNWTCKTLEECGHVRGDPVEVCSFQGIQPIVCCRPKRRVRSASKANYHCKQFLRLCDPVYSDPQVWSKIDPAQVYRPYVVGGRTSLPMAHPHMALLGYGPDKEWNCGGSLISERYVLSAAHCSKQPSLGPPLWARLGELDYEDNTDEAAPRDYIITDIINHPDYQEPLLYHDIALFKLNQDVELNNFVKPACLHTSMTVPFTKAIATGWGRVGFAGDVSRALREVELSIVPGNACVPIFQNSKSTRFPQGVNPRTMICAGEKEGGKDTCSGDSGGPLVIQMSNKCLKTQVGITSFGRQCGLPNSPGVYTRVAAYVSWIESIVWPDLDEPAPY